nr:folate-binding protein YgfZ [Corynebacterium lactis]
MSHVSGAAALDAGLEAGQEGSGSSGQSAVAWHYGNPLVEQRHLQEDCGVVDRSHYRVIEVTGEDRLTYLNTLFSQKVDEAQPGTVTEALNLDPNGHVVHHMTLTVLEDSVLIDVAPVGFESLLKYLTMMIFWSKVEVREAERAIISVMGPKAPEMLVAAGLAFPQVGKAASVGNSYVRHLPWPSGGRVDVLVRRENLVGAWDALVAAGAAPVGLMGWEAERVVSLRPEMGLDIDEKMIPHEAPRWIASEFDAAAVHLNKGCYRGQETVSRVHNVGRSPRVLVMLQLDGSATLPSTGDAVMSGKRSVGRVGTVVHHADFGPIALALVKRSAQESQGLTVGDCAVTVDPASIDRIEQLPPGRVAMNKLRGKE